MKGTTIGVIQGDTRSLDNGSYGGFGQQGCLGAILSKIQMSQNLNF